MICSLEKENDTFIIGGLDEMGRDTVIEVSLDPSEIVFDNMVFYRAMME